MRIYCHPVSTTCRPLMLFAADSGLDIDFKLVDLFTGEHLKEAYAAINPNRLVPVPEDGDFRLTEGFYAHFVTPFEDAPFEGL